MTSGTAAISAIDLTRIYTYACNVFRHSHVRIPAHRPLRAQRPQARWRDGVRCAGGPVHLED